MSIHIDLVVTNQFFFSNEQDDLIELAGAIDENEVDFFVLKPKFKRLSHDKEIWGQVLRVREKKVYIEIFQQSIKLVRKSWMNEYYDISFKLNRVPYQLQHFALDFMKKEQLFSRLMNNCAYNSNNIQPFKREAEIRYDFSEKIFSPFDSLNKNK